MSNNTSLADHLFGNLLNDNNLMNNIRDLPDLDFDTDFTDGAITTRSPDGTLIMDQDVGRLLYLHGRLLTMGEADVPSFNGVVTKQRIEYEVVDIDNPSLTVKQVQATHRIMKYGGLLKSIGNNDKCIYSLLSIFVTKDGEAQFFIDVLDDKNYHRQFKAVAPAPHSRITSIVQLSVSDTIPSIEGYDKIYEVENQHAIYELKTFNLSNGFVIGAEDADNTEPNIFKRLLIFIKKIVSGVISRIREFIGKVVNFFKNLFSSKKEKFEEIKKQLPTIDPSSEQAKVILKDLETYLSEVEVNYIDTEFSRQLQEVTISSMEHTVAVLKGDIEGSELLEYSLDKITTPEYKPIVKELFNGRKVDITKKLPLLKVLSLRTGVNFEKLDIDFNNVATIYEQLFTQLHKQIESINNNEVKFINNISVKASQLQQLLVNEIADEDSKIDKDQASFIIQTVFQSTVQVITNVLYKEVMSEVTMYNTILKKFESSLSQMIHVDGKALSQKQTEQVTEMIKDCKVYDTVEGHEVYAISDVFGVLAEKFPELEAVSSARNDSLPDAVVFRPYNGSKCIIGLSGAALNGNNILKTFLMYHEYGHVKHNHMAINIQKMMHHAVSNDRPKLVSIMQSGLYRNVRHEVQADMEAYEKIGKENTISALKLLKRVHGVPGKVIGERDNDINTRIKYFENKK